MTWLSSLGVPPRQLDAPTLRVSLMTFLMGFSHRPNTRSIHRARFDPREARGAEVFASSCERCHEARLVTDEPSTRQPPASWEGLVLSREGPIVWASAAYQATGVTPYVHELGARPPSLRRVYKKWPYFTNGSAKSLAELVARARLLGDRFWHDAGPADARALSGEDQSAVLAFLELL